MDTIKKIFWLIMRWAGIGTVLTFLFILFLFSSFVTAMSQVNITFASTIVSKENKCHAENNCTIEDIIPLGNPVDNTCITSTFYDRRPWGLHGAVDFVGGGEIKATHDGIVSVEIFSAGSCRLNGSNYSYSAYPNINVSNDEYKTEYLHMVDIQVEDGQIVKKGDVLGIMGNEGCSTGTHLHYEIHEKEDGAWHKINPEDGFVNALHC